MSKDLHISYLMDFYGQLLTEKQFHALDFYYNDDLSLAEIAEELEISRQGVRDFIKRGEKLLCEFEEKLGLASRFMRISSELEDINSVIEKLSRNEELKNYSNDFDKIKQSLNQIIIDNQ